MSIIKKVILGKLIGSLVKQRGDKNYYDGKNNNYADHSNLKAIKSGAPFALLSIFAIMFFVVLGLYEILFNSPLSDWIAKSWGSITNTSPQTIVNIPKQIPTGDNLMQKTVGDWLGVVPSFFEQIVSFISAPLTSILGIIIVFVAIAVRLGRHILGLFSPASLGKGFAKIISWIILALSFAPLAIEHL